jgi:hypothetical protein
VIKFLACESEEIPFIFDFMLLVPNLLKVFFVDLLEFPLLQLESHVVLNELTESILNMKS